MARYRLIFKESVAKDLRGLPKKDVARILARLDSLADAPRAPGCEKLSGADKYRVRCGIYHIVYEIKDDTLVVMVVKIGHRREVYRIR